MEMSCDSPLKSLVFCQEEHAMAFLCIEFRAPQNTHTTLAITRLRIGIWPQHSPTQA